MTSYILWKLIQRKGIARVQTHLIAYADDFHGSWLCCSETSMYKATRDVADLLDALESAGLTLNLAKSAAMFKATGPKLKSFCKTHVMRRADGVYLKCATRAGKTYHVPLVKKWDYLGAILSYAAFESDTVMRRVRAADHAFTKLRQVLGSRRSLSLAQRLSVYDACVQSTLLYGTLAVGVTPADAKQIKAASLAYHVERCQPASRSGASHRPTGLGHHGCAAGSRGTV